jgi:hypothetical protein
LRDPLADSAISTDSSDEALTTAQPDAQALIELSFSDLDPDKLQTDSLLDGVDRLAALSLPGFVQVIVTGDFEEAFDDVKPTYSECFTQARIGGVAFAKTVTDGGSSIILVDVKALFPDVASQLSCPLSRILEHEGQHLLLRARHEDAHTTHYRLADRETPKGWLALLAAFAIEEFRVEAALTKSGSFKHEDAACVEALGLVSCKIKSLRAETDPDELDKEFKICLRDLVMLAAERAAGCCGGQDVPDSITGHLALGAIWPRFSGALALIPASDIAIREADLNEHACALAALLEEWLRHLGFAFASGEPDRAAFICLERA